MEKELLEMSLLWKKTALEMLAKSEPASRTEFANQMLLACAQMLEYKLNESGGILLDRLPETPKVTEGSCPGRIQSSPEVRPDEV